MPLGFPARNAYAYTYSYSYIYAYPYSYSDSYRNIYANCYCYRDCDCDCNCYAATQPTPTATATSTATVPPSPTPTPTPSACIVYIADPHCHSVINTQPVDFSVQLSDPTDPSTVQPTDFTVNGIPADSYTIFNPTYIVFHFNTSPVVQGLNVMHIPAGAFNVRQLGVRRNSPVPSLTSHLRLHLHHSPSDTRRDYT